MSTWFARVQEISLTFCLLRSLLHPEVTGMLFDIGTDGCTQTHRNLKVVWWLVSALVFPYLPPIFDYCRPLYRMHHFVSQKVPSYSFTDPAYVFIIATVSSSGWSYVFETGRLSPTRMWTRMESSGQQVLQAHCECGIATWMNEYLQAAPNTWTVLDKACANQVWSRQIPLKAEQRVSGKPVGVDIFCGREWSH